MANQPTSTLPEARDLVRQAAAALRLGQAAEARAGLLKAAGLAAGDGALLEEIARALEDAGDPAAAAKIYKRSLMADPGRFLAHARLGSLLYEEGQITAAIFHLEHANQIQPDDPAILNNLGLMYQVNGEYPRAIETLTRALEKGGPEGLIKGTLAGLYEETNRLDQLRALLAEALPKFPGDFYLNFVAAKLKRREGATEEAMRHLLRFDPSGQPNDARIVYYFELGRIFNTAGDYDRAYENFELGNRLSAGEPAFRPYSKEKSRDNIRTLAALDLSSWTRAGGEGSSGEAPVFLVGFPRSGTTLLNQILDGHPGIEVLEEKPTLARLAARVGELPGSFPAALETIDDAALASLRGLYFTVAEGLRKRDGQRRLIDKFPLQILDIPFILKLFPGAKIILALRHPCDVAVSCFMQNFGPNNAMLNFLNLDDATSYYAAVMGLWQRYRRELRLDVHIVRYERVVEDLAGEARALVSFLGLPWDEGVLGYREQALAKSRINTPSYHQVIKPIYREAVGRWRHYEKFLKPFLPRLEPFCKDFGYDL